MTQYGVNQIQTLEGVKAIRTLPGMYIGSTDLNGVHHIVLEIISNSIDEYLAKECDMISIRVNEDDSIAIQDNGRGVPFGKRKDGSETMENIFTVLHTGAKFNSDGSTGYNSSGGMHGVGSKATNALSEYFAAHSVRDGKIAKIRFRKGIKEEFTVAECAHERGTLIIFKPDIEIFKSGITLDKKRLAEQLEEFSFLCPGLTLTLDFKGEKQSFNSTDGLVNYIDKLTKNKTQITDIFNFTGEEDDYSLSVAFAYTDNSAEVIKIYTNNIPNTAGTHLTGFRSAMTRSINELARKNNLLKEKDNNLTGEDLKEGLVLALSLHMPEPMFDGQTKNVLTSSEGRTIVERLVSKQLKILFTQKQKDLKTIVSKAIISRKARKDQKKKNNEKKKKKKIVKSTLPGKLTDCLSKQIDERELFIVEGESAGGGAKMARDKNTQAILPLQG